MKRYSIRDLDPNYVEEARYGQWARWDDVEAVEADRDALEARYTAQTGFFAELELERQKTTVERDALKAEVERLKAERTQDVSIRREQCEALADSERGMFAAIDRHQMAAAEVERLRAALCEIAAGEHVQTSAAVAREALEKK